MQHAVLLDRHEHRAPDVLACDERRLQRDLAGGVGVAFDLTEFGDRQFGDRQLGAVLISDRNTVPLQVASVRA